MTKEERTALVEQLQKVRQEIDGLHSEAFTTFVEAVHNLGLMLIPFTKGQEALAYKLTEIEGKLREEVMSDD